MRMDRRTTMTLVLEKIDAHPEATRRVENLTVYCWNKATGVGWAIVFDGDGRFHRAIRMDTDPEVMSKRLQPVLDGLGLRT